MKHTQTKLLNTYQLSNSLSYSKTINALSFTLFDDFKSSVVNLSPKNIKDENQLKFSTLYSFEKTALGLSINSRIYNDDRKSAINRSSINHILFFSQINLIDKTMIKPFAGYSFNSQAGKLDKGLLYGSEFLLNELMFEDFILNSQLSFQNEDINPRKNISRNVYSEIITRGSGSFSNQLLFLYNQNGQDFYFRSDSLASQQNSGFFIQNRDEKNYIIQNNFRIDNIFTNLSFMLSGQLSIKAINRFNKDSFVTTGFSYLTSNLDELKINLQSTISYHTDNFTNDLNISYSEKDEKHSLTREKGMTDYVYETRKEIEERKNNKSGYTTISLNSEFHINKTNKLIFNLFHRKYIYNTPSKINYDDRDEILSILRIGYHSQISPFFNFFTNIEGSFNHLVYIFSELSSNNNKKRFIKLSTGGNYIGKQFESRNLFEVSAHYTTYDFEYLNQSYQSFSFRQFLAKDSTSVPINSVIGFLLQTYYKIAEQGNFKWESFSGTPIRYISEFYCEPKLYYKLNELKIYAGLRFFLLTTYSYNQNIKKMISEYKSIGPVFAIDYDFKNLKIKFNYLYEFVKSHPNYRSEIGNMNLELNWLL